MADNEFTIRVTGASPPPLPSANTTKKGRSRKGGGGRAKATGKNIPPLSSQQQQRRYNLRLRPSSSLEKLRTDVFALFNIPSDCTSSYRLSFLGGFPPKELNSVGKSTVNELGIRPNESLIVKFSLLTSEDDNSTKKGSTSESTNGDAKQPATILSASESSSLEVPNNCGRPKRASAMAATANFRDVIAAQDAILNNTKKTAKKKSAGNNKIGGFGGNANRRIVTHSVAASNRPKKIEIDGAGYRLSDGKSFAGSPSKNKNGGNSKRIKQKPLFESKNGINQGKDDVATTLLSSLNGGGKGGNVGKFLRMAMRGAVAKSYEASRAAVRVAAVNDGGYNFERVKGGSVVEGGGVLLGTAKDHELPRSDDCGESATPADDETLERTLYTVAYSKGMEGRGRYEEQVQIVGLAALKAVLESIYNTKSSGDPNDPEEIDDKKNTDGKEMLRPVSIAQLSPQTFWSLVYHSSEAAKKDPNSNVLSVEAMLQYTMPHLDWAYLDRGGRKRVLSEKARENLRQKKRPTPNQIPSPSEEEAVKVIEEMEEFIMKEAIPNGEEGKNGQELNERERRAKAAMARFGSDKENANNALPALSPIKNDTIDEWTLVTPAEEDIDELIECIMDGVASSEEGKESSSERYDQDTAIAWAGILMDSVRNYRELANANVDDVLPKFSDRHPGGVPSSDTVEKWIDAAQSRSLEEIMLEILDGDQDALELLRDHARSSCPRDLSNWRSAPGLLLDAISRGGAEGGDNSKTWERSDVVRWIRRAKVALGVCTWLELFTT